MKRNDLATVVLIAGVATLAAFLLANSIFGDPNEESVTLKYMDVISSEIDQPDNELFNDLAINPTVETFVGKCRPNQTWDEETSTCVSDYITDDEDGENNQDEDDETSGETGDNTNTCDPNDPDCINEQPTTPPEE